MSDSVLDLGRAHCPFCQRGFKGTPVSVCQHCTAPVHTACVAELVTCTTYACGGTVFNDIGIVEGQVSVPQGDQQWERPEPEPEVVIGPQPEPRPATQEQIDALPDEVDPQGGWQNYLTWPLIIIVLLFARFGYTAYKAKSQPPPRVEQPRILELKQPPKPADAIICPNCKGDGIGTDEEIPLEARDTYRYWIPCDWCGGKGFLPRPGSEARQDD